MTTVRMTMAGALVRWLRVQRTELDGELVPVFPGTFAIFGHGNVTALGHALESVRDELPTWRGQNEQSMVMAATAFARARRRRQIMVATSSIGPGATNMVTGAGIAMANRLPVLLLAGETFTSRLPDPVLQQVEHFGDPTLTVNDAFKPVVRYWDRIVDPAQLLTSLPAALSTMLDPSTCGPALLALPQDTQACAYDYPEAFFEPRIWGVRRPRPDEGELALAAATLLGANRPLIVAGGGVRYSGAEAELRRFAEVRGIPVAETVAGRGSLAWDHPNNVGAIGVTGSSAANAVAARADVVLALGTRLQDFTTGSWTVFEDPGVRIIGANVNRFDAHKNRALPLVGDAREVVTELDAALRDGEVNLQPLREAQIEVAAWNAYIDERREPDGSGLPSYAQVIGAVNEVCPDETYVVAAAGGLPGELNMAWRHPEGGGIDIEYGFSCMGYEIGGAWGAKMASPTRPVVSLVGDGSWLMANSEVFSTVRTGHPVIFVLCENGGYAVIDRLQRSTGSPSFNNQLIDSRHERDVRVDFVAHARALGALAERVESVDGLRDSLVRALAADRTSVIVIDTDPDAWLEGGAWWEVGVPEVSDREPVRLARSDHEAGKARQRRLG